MAAWWTSPGAGSWAGTPSSTSFAAIEEKVRANTALCLDRSREPARPPRDAALELAEGRVRKAMTCRRWSLPPPKGA